MSNSQKDFRTDDTSYRAAAHHPDTAGISRPSVIPAFRAPSNNSNGKTASPEVQPFQLLRSGAVPGQPVVQRIAFKNNTGTTTVDISEGTIVEHLNKWIIGKMSTDALTTSPLFTELHPNHLNWDEVFTKGGHERKVQNSFDAYNVLKEVKMTPGYTFALEHGVAGQQNQFASSTLKNSDRTKKGAIDGMLFPSNDLDEDVQGEGVAYKELSMSFTALAGKHGGDAAVAKAHLKLMKGETPAGYTDDEISKMRYHIEVLQLAEGRRSAGMFMFAPIGLQNIADGTLTGPEAFGKVENKKVKTKGGEKKWKDVVTKEGDYPSAWVGSKKPLETVESHFAAGKGIGDAPMHLKNNKAILDKMKLQITKFFSTTNRTDFTKAAISGTPGAAFTNENEALTAITNLIRDTYFPMIPAFYDDPHNDTPVRKTNRDAALHLLGQHQIQHTVHGLTQDMMETEPKNEFKGLLPETKKDALKLTAKDPEERKHNKRHRKLVVKVRDTDMERFSDDDSADELEKDVTSVVDRRNKFKKAPLPDKEKLKVKKNLKRKLEEKVDGNENLDTQSVSDEFLHHIDKFLVEKETTKKFKSDAFQKGRDLADAEETDLSGLTGFAGQEATVQEGFNKRVQELGQEGYFAGLRGEDASPLKVHVHASTEFGIGLAARNNIIAMAIKDKTEGKQKFYLDLTGLVTDFASRDTATVRDLNMLYQRTFAEHKL